MRFPMVAAVDAVIAFTVIECVGLAAFHRLTGRGVAPRDFVVNMGSGLCLMLALRCALTDASALSTALALSAAGLAHGTDLLLRWRRELPIPTLSQDKKNRSVLT